MLVSATTKSCLETAPPLLRFHERKTSRMDFRPALRSARMRWTLAKARGGAAAAGSESRPGLEAGLRWSAAAATDGSLRARLPPLPFCRALGAGTAVRPVAAGVAEGVAACRCECDRLEDSCSTAVAE
jgi:hypothetical protein